MKKTKRIAAAILCVAMVVSALASCGNKGTSQTGGADTVRIWTGDSHSKVTMNRIISDFNSGKGKEMGVKIDYSAKDGDYGQQLEMALASDQAPEMFNWGGWCDTYAEKGYITALDDMPGGKEYIDSYDKQYMTSILKYKDKTYKVPFYVTTVGLVYNKDLFEKYGIVDEKGEALPPQTFEEVREYAKKLTNPEEKEYGIVLPLKNDWFVGTDVEGLLLSSAGKGAFDPVTGKYDFEGLKPIFDMYMGIKEDKSYFPGAEGLTDDPARAQFSQGSIGMKLSASYDVAVFTEQFPATCDWGVAPMPVADINNCYKQRTSSSGYLVINSKATEKFAPEKLMDVFKWFHGEEVLTELYKDCMAIPYDYSMVKDVKLSKELPNWSTFCSFTDISTPIIIIEPKIDLSGKKNSTAIFMQDIWTGNMTSDEAVQELNKTYNDALAQVDPAEIEKCLIPDLDIRR